MNPIISIISVEIYSFKKLFILLLIVLSEQVLPFIKKAVPLIHLYDKICHIYVKCVILPSRLTGLDLIKKAQPWITFEY